MKEAEALEVSKKVLEGTATEAERGMVLRNIQTGLAGNLVAGLSDAMATINSFNAHLDRCINQLTLRLESDVQIMDATQLIDIITKIQTRQLATLDLYRKVVQGKDLFPVETLSDEEKKVLKLIKSFRSKEEKDKFFQICSEMLKPAESIDFDE